MCENSLNEDKLLEEEGGKFCLPDQVNVNRTNVPFRIAGSADKFANEQTIQAEQGRTSAIHSVMIEKCK
jgi:hypothetical protein